MEINELQNKLNVLTKLNEKVAAGLAKSGKDIGGLDAEEKMEVAMNNLQAAEHEYSEIINALVRSNVLTLEEATSGLEQ